MPINLSNDPLSAIKIGESDILKGYIGIDQMFPNNTSITAAAFDNAGSTITTAAQNQPYTVAGDIGSSFTLQGTLGATSVVGTQVLSTSPTTYQIAIGANTSCAAPGRSPTITILNQGNTVFDPVSLQTTSTVTQPAGPPYVTNTTTITMSSSGSGPTVNVGGQLRWAVGATMTISFSMTTSQTLSSIYISTSPNLNSAAWSASNNGISPQAWDTGQANNLGFTGSNSSLGGITGGSITYTFLGQTGTTSLASMGAVMALGDTGCNQATVSSGSTIVYP